MKKGLLFFVLLLGISLSLVAQSVPQGMNYQAVARNTEGKVLAGEPIQLKVSLLGDGPQGKVMYSEIHDVMTSPLGLFNVVIGQGTAGMGDFAEINWGSTEVWMDMALKIDDAFVSINTTPLLSVPYAFHAGTAGKLTGADPSEKAAGPYWKTNGNDGVFDQFQFLGTVDAKALVFRTNNQERMSLLPSGDLQMSQNNIKNLKDPVDPQDAVTKGYVDGAQPALQAAIDAHVAADNDLDPTNEIELPSGGSSGQVLSTDGIGNYAWVEPDTGPQGPQGIQGEVGPQGPQGPAGPAGPQGAFPDGTSPGEMNYWNGNSWVSVAPGTTGQTLTFCDGVPTWGPCPVPLYIGDSHAGGIIFYLDASGQHGLVAATNDQSSSAKWGCYGTLIGGTSAALGSGQSNTTAIVNGCGEAGIAARICDDYSVTVGVIVYDDWFLPSKAELNLMYLNRNAIGGFDNSTSTGFYWSSTESDNAYYAWWQGFSVGNQVGYLKSFNRRVRAVRAF